MNPFDITIFYAFHGSPESEHQEFPPQTLASDRIQLIPVIEDDFYHPRKRTLEQLSKARGRYTIMLDEGDLLEPSDTFLEHLLSVADGAAEPAAFFMPSATCQHVKRSKEYFSLKKNNRPRSYESPLGNFIIDIEKCPFVLPMALHGLLLRTEELKEALIDANEAEPEKSALVRLLRRTDFRFLYVGSCDIEYVLPRECDHQYDMRCMLHEWYYDPFEKFLLPLLEEEEKQGKVSRLLQTMALHMVHIRIYANTNNKNKHVIHPEEIPVYRDLLSRVLHFVEIRNILCVDTNITSSGNKNKLLDIRLKQRDFTVYPDIVSKGKGLELQFDGCKFGDITSIAARINLIDYIDGRLEIDGGMNDYFSAADACVYARLGDERYPVVYNERFSLTKCFGVTFSRMKTFHVSVPVPPSDRERVLSFVLTANGAEYRMDYNFPSFTSRFAKDFTYTYWRFGPYLSYWKPDGIHIVKAKKLKILYKEYRLWRQIFESKDGAFRRHLPVKILNFLLRPYFSRQKIWLFLDKIYKGGDSSEYIYRYAREKKDGIRKYYLLDKDSADYKRMRKEGYRPLKRGTLKHRLIFLNADLVIASNSTIPAFNGYGFKNALPFRGDLHSDVACVQHGMSVQKIAMAQQRLRDNTKLYFCASRYEIENLSKPIYDYRDYDILKLTGVPRYDGLKDRAQKIILISPTWRMNSALPVTISEGVSRDYNPHFKDTDYYRVYNGLINDPRLLAAAKEHGYRIQYVLHPIVSPQHDDFTKNDYVEIIPSIGDMSYEKLFCEAALMVTDFSGVQFDFAYMRKPVVYLHHEDIPQHYEEGTFHYTTMGFGEICHTNNELIDVLCRYMENGCQMPQMYRDRADDFFAFSDNRNCERIYPVMLEFEEKKRRQMTGSAS